MRRSSPDRQNPQPPWNVMFMNAQSSDGMQSLPNSTYWQFAAASVIRNLVAKNTRFPISNLRNWKNITDRRPDQLKFKFALWVFWAIKELLSRKFGIQIYVVLRADTCRSLILILYTKLRSDLPGSRIPSKIGGCLKEHSAIRKKAAVEKGGTIFWADES